MKASCHDSATLIVDNVQNAKAERFDAVMCVTLWEDVPLSALPGIPDEATDKGPKELGVGGVHVIQQL
jgi:hypothetical protein